MQSNSIVFPAKYDSIMQRLNQVNPVKYAKTRNFLNGDITYLSPYLSRGVISTKQVKDTILSKGFSKKASEKLIQELAWREYFQRVWQQKGNDIWNDLKQLQANVNHNEMVLALQNSKTGIQAIDDQVKNLYQTGYLHNHLRMYIAAIACNNGRAHWLKPSKWMYYHLLDGDIASNNCSWQWVAGSFSSKKYYCNQENINLYTGISQYNTFLDKSYDEISSMSVPDQLIEKTEIILNTKLPITQLPKIDTTKPTVLYNSYNMDPQWRKDENVNRVLLLEPSHFNNYPVSEKVIEFVLSLADNIPGIQIYAGPLSDITHLYEQKGIALTEVIISKEHPAFTYYPGIKDQRDWMFPNVTGYFPSFFSYWKKCLHSL